jgi:2-oxoglutarate dehydrogenase E1 component
VVKRYKNAEIYWAQEEPFNQGPWSYVEPRIVTAIKSFCDKRPFFVGRNAAASPATGR